MGCAGSKPHLWLSSSLRDHHNHPAAPQKGHILFNAKTIHYLSHNESHVKAKLVQRCELKLAKELASSTSSAETMSDAKRVRRLASVTLAVDQVIKHAQSDFDADSWNKSSNQLYIKQIHKDIMRKHSSSSLHLLATTPTTSTATISSSSSPQSASMQRTSSSSSASNNDEAAFYKRAMRTAIYEFGSFIQENFTLINGFDEASNNNHNNEKENAPTTQDCTPPTDAAVVVVQTTISVDQAPAEATTTPSEQGGGESSATATATEAAAAAEEAATSLATVDKQVSEMRDAERPMSDALAKIQPVAATASSPTPLLTLQVEKGKAVTESSVAVAGVEVEAEEEATSEDKRSETRGSNWLVGLISCFFLMTWAFSSVFALSRLNNNNNNNVDCQQRMYSLDTLVVSVSNLSSVELSAPLRWIKRGNEMPVNVSVSPLGFASAPHLRYEWSTSDVLMSPGSQYHVGNNIDKHAHKITSNIDAHIIDQCDNDTLIVSTALSVIASGLLTASPSKTGQRQRSDSSFATCLAEESDLVLQSGQTVASSSLIKIDFVQVDVARTKKISHGPLGNNTVFFTQNASVAKEKQLYYIELTLFAVASFGFVSCLIFYIYKEKRMRHFLSVCCDVIISCNKSFCNYEYFKRISINKRITF